MSWWWGWLNPNPNGVSMFSSKRIEQNGNSNYIPVSFYYNLAPPFAAQEKRENPFITDNNKIFQLSHGSGKVFTSKKEFFSLTHFFTKEGFINY
jgi:hypothetical protein